MQRDFPVTMRHRYATDSIHDEAEAEAEALARSTPAAPHRRDGTHFINSANETVAISR